VTKGAWQTAAEDLGIAVTAPASLDGEVCIALVHEFGSPHGTAVVPRGGERESATVAAALAAGHYVSIVNADSYATYDRNLFVGTLDDWGWYGSGDPPSWYSGTAWGT
jgi:hypothetical protein